MNSNGPNPVQAGRHLNQTLENHLKPAVPRPDAPARLTIAWWFCLIAVTAWRFWAAASFPLQGTEAYYWLWSEHLAPGYYDHPPLVAWAIRLGTLLAGRTELGVRLPALAAVTAATWAIHALGCRMGGPQAGARAGLAALAFPYLTFMSVTSFPDGPMLAFAGVSLLAAWDGRWCLSGAACGLSFLGKFPAALLAPGTILWCRRPKYLALWATSGLLVASPFLVWNAQHGWPTFAFQFIARHQAESRFHWAGPLEFLGVQAAAASPVLFLALLGAQVWSARRWDRAGSFAVLYTAPILAVFALLSFSLRVQPHWPLVAFLPALAALGRAACGSASIRSWWRVGVVTGGALTALLLLAFVTPDLLFRVVGRPGGSSLTEPFALKEAGPILAGRVPAGGFLVAESHGVAAPLEFSSGRTVHWYSLNLHGREYLRWEDYASLRGREALFVDVAPLADRPDVRALLERAFQRVGDCQPLRMDWHGRPARTLYLTPCQGFRGQPPSRAVPAIP